MATGGIRVHLASRSPRRRQLLTEAGIEHDADHPGIDDSELSPGSVPPAHWVAAMAYLKAVCARERGGRGSRLVLGADTVCVKDGMILAAPEDESEARAMLCALRNGSHEVLTGVAMLGPGNEGEIWSRDIFVDRARVHVGDIPDTELEAYIASGEWRGKAGGYNLRERIDAGWPIEFEGDPTTIMGLPMRALRSRLAPDSRARG